MSAVYGVIRKLGATSKYKGYYYVVDAVEMAGCTMADKPTNSEFIDILVYYLRYSDKD